MTSRGDWVKFVVQTNCFQTLPEFEPVAFEIERATFLDSANNEERDEMRNKDN